MSEHERPEQPDDIEALAHVPHRGSLVRYLERIKALVPDADIPSYDEQLRQAAEEVDARAQLQSPEPDVPTSPHFLEAVPRNPAKPSQKPKTLPRPIDLGVNPRDLPPPPSASSQRIPLPERGRDRRVITGSQIARAGFITLGLVGVGVVADWLGFNPFKDGGEEGAPRQGLAIPATAEAGALPTLPALPTDAPPESTLLPTLPPEEPTLPPAPELMGDFPQVPNIELNTEGTLITQMMEQARGQIVVNQHRSIQEYILGDNQGVLSTTFPEDVKPAALVFAQNIEGVLEPVMYISGQPGADIFFEPQGMDHELALIPMPVDLLDEAVDKYDDARELMPEGAAWVTSLPVDGIDVAIATTLKAETVGINKSKLMMPALLDPKRAWATQALRHIDTDADVEVPVIVAFFNQDQPATP